MRILTVLGSKGGVGKSTLCSNLLVAARLAGVDAAGLDLDRQHSLLVWATRRAEAGADPFVPCREGHFLRWREETAAPPAALLVVDTPPGLPDREHLTAVRELALASSLVIVPALAEGPSLEMLGEVGAALGELGASLFFVLNKVDARKRATRASRAYLEAYGQVSPVEIPAREVVHQAMHAGLSVLDGELLSAGVAMRALWAWAAKRLELA